eukprot:scpid107186/ scgid13896/ 
MYCCSHQTCLPVLSVVSCFTKLPTNNTLTLCVDGVPLGTFPSNLMTPGVSTVCWGSAVYAESTLCLHVPSDVIILIVTCAVTNSLSVFITCHSPSPWPQHHEPTALVLKPMMSLLATSISYDVIVSGVHVSSVLHRSRYTGQWTPTHIRPLVTAQCVCVC